jgi:hypothetical protein
VAVGVLPLVALIQAWSSHPAPQDDAFISFRYAANLLAGHGLVYNPGEWVEGFTNLSWTLLSATVMAAGIDPVVGMAALGTLALAGLVLLGARLGSETAGLAGAVVAGALLATDLQAGLEAVEGLETTFYALLIGGGMALAVRESGRPGPAWRVHLGSTALFAIAALTRPEAPLHITLVHVGLLLSSRERGRQLRAGMAAAVPFAGVLLGLTAWRLHTYGYPLPNTFYAKTGGAPLARGATYLLAHAVSHPALWGLALARALAGRPSRWTLPAAALVLGQLAYVLAVGGDFKPTGRFLIPVALPAAVLAAESAAGLVRARSAAVRWGGLVAIAAALLVGTFRMAGQVRGWAQYRHEDFMARRVVGEFLGRSFPADTLIAIHSAGCIPHYSGLPTIDMWGLTDAHIARAPVPEMGTGMAGHERGDPEYVFGRQPAMYLPEDHLFTLQPHELSPGPGFPADFEERYRAITIPVEGRALNVWVRKGFIDGLNAGGR